MCIAPKVLVNSGHISRQGLTVPCGKCHLCRKKRASNWAFRLEQEDRVSSCSLFVTLTYDDQYLPLIDECDDDGVINPYANTPTLFKDDLQLFFKRLRKKTKARIKYYACGEYGTATKRPHYHAIIFNADEDDILDAWCDDSTPMGNVFFGKADSAAIRYVSNYLQKSSGDFPPGTVPEFALMSLGLGKSYLTFDRIMWHQLNDANYCVRPGGVKQSLPRYYKDVIFDPSQRRDFGLQFTLQYNQEVFQQMKRLSIPVYMHNVTEAKKQSEMSAIYRSKMRNKL